MRTFNNLLDIKFIWIIYILVFCLSTHAYSFTAVQVYDTLIIPQKKKEYNKWLREFEQTESGLQYKIIKQGTGLQPNVGDLVAVHYKGFLSDNQQFDNSYTKGEPLEFNHGVGQVINGWDEVLNLFRAGTKAIVVIPPALGYGSMETDKIPANSTLIFEIELLQVVRQIPIEPFDTELIQAIISEDGIMFYPLSSNKGAKPDSSKIVTFHFTGFLPNGKIFDSSVITGAPEKIRIGDPSVIKGINIALMLMRKGEKARFVIPSKLAYGSKGYSTLIPPNTDLTFDIELIEIKDVPRVEPFEANGVDTVTLDNGLRYIPIHKTNNESPQKNDIVGVHYSAYFENNKLFDTSVLRDKEIMFSVGDNEVLEGIDKIVTHMHIGERYRVFIPYKFAFGETGSPPVIPAKTNLIYDIELLYIVK